MPAFAALLAGCTAPLAEAVDVDVRAPIGAGLGGDTGVPLRTTSPPNLLLVLLDDVGTDKIAAYGESPTAPTTPTLSSLAGEGVLFRNAWASPICGPSRAMLLTGRYGRRYGYGQNIALTDDYRLPAGERLLPGWLAEAPVPYASVQLGKWHLAGPSPGYARDPLDRGFEHAIGTMSNAPSYSWWISADDGVLAPRSGYLTTATADDAIASIAAMPEPWFAYLAFNAPHAPEHVPPDPLNPGRVTARDGVVALYDAMLVAADLELGRVLASMDPDVRARTTIVAMGDNGTPGFAITPPSDPRRGKQTLWEGGVNVPLVVAGAGVEAPGTESAALVHLVDVAATLLDLGGVDPRTLPLDGTSFRAQLRDPDAPGARERLYTEYLGANGPPPWPRESTAVRDARFKLVTLLGVEGLYDLRGRDDDGPNLLRGPLDPEAAAALDALRAERDRVLATPYDGD